MPNKISSIFILVLIISGCSTSSKTSEVVHPQIGNVNLDLISDASAQVLDPPVNNGKFQITISGHFNQEISCLVLIDNLLIEVVDPTLNNAIIASSKLNEDYNFKIISKIHLGDFKVRLVNTHGSKVLAFKDIKVTENEDRFDINFSSCVK